jgi:hypothetical protein
MNSVGVREVRLISRLRHRQFGVFVNMSHFNPQVYSEVRSDGHRAAVAAVGVCRLVESMAYADQTERD